MHPSSDQFAGALLGLALGDAMGAPYEGGWLERLVWRFISTTRDGCMRWTDDTQMSLDIAESVISCGDFNPDDAAQRFAKSYRWSRGYGPAAAKLLKLIRRGKTWSEANRAIYREGSFGNGGAMRAPVIGLLDYRDHDALMSDAAASAEITHAHPLGIEGARVIAFVSAASLGIESPVNIVHRAAELCRLAPFSKKLHLAQGWLKGGASISPLDVASELGTGITAAESCVTAIYIALRFITHEFIEMHKFAVACGGDVDAIAAMSGAIWGARNGADRLPSEQLAVLEDRDRIVRVAEDLYDLATLRDGSRKTAAH